MYLLPELVKYDQPLLCINKRCVWMTLLAIVGWAKTSSKELIIRSLSLRRGIFEQIKHFTHEVVLMRIRLIVHGQIESPLKHGNNISAISSRYKVKFTSNLLNELILACSGLFVHVYFVGDHHAGNVGALYTHLFVPTLQILIGDLAARIEDKDHGVCTKVIRWVQLVKGFLSCGIPNVYLLVLTIYGTIVSVHRKRVRRTCSLFVVV